MKIYQLKPKNLYELKEMKTDGKYFPLEIHIQELIDKNLNKIFNDLEFIKSEYKIDDLRIDTVAFDNERRSFVIIEYKNKKNESLIDQGVSYYQVLQDRKSDFVLLYNELKNKKFRVQDIKWDETRIIFISTKFSKYQRKASGFQGLPIELYGIKRFEQNIITLDRVGSIKTEHVSRKNNASKINTPILTEYIEDDYFNGKYGNTALSSKSKTLWHDLKNKILDNFENLEFKQKKKYGGFYSTSDNSLICTMTSTKDTLTLDYSTTKPNFFTKNNFVKYTLKGHYGAGHYRSKIHNRDDIDNSIQYIKKVYDYKIK